MSSFYNPNATLELSLTDILAVIKPLEEDVRARNQIINDFTTVVQSIESLRGATVEPFGSFVSNLYTRWGDLDISIELPCGSLVSSAGKKRKQSSLREIRKILHRRGIVRNLQFVPNARVPLLIFKSNRTNISCDISVNNLIGQIKSKFFLWITQIDERFRDMVLLIKEWAKSQNINDPKTGTLNSYSLCLLVIFHFQTCDPAILPPLNEIYLGNIADDLIGVRFNVERSIQNTCTANIARFTRDGSRRVNRSSLSELFISFFQKFSRINMMASEQVICTYTGRWEYKRNNPKWTSKDYPLLIEDPFEQAENTARAVAVTQLARISEAFDGTHRKLLSTNNRNYLISSLVNPHIESEIITRTRGIPTALPRGGGIGYNQQMSSAVPQYQSQFQNMRYENHPSPNVSFQRPGPTFQGQSQQVWRPRNGDN